MLRRLTPTSVVASAGLWSALAFGFNLAWEIAHVRLYTLWTEDDGPGVAWALFHCTLGDVLIALASSGPHSNGYSLVRKILEVSGCDPLTTELDGKPLADHLLAPTRIYVKNVLELIENVDVHAIAHLTGGGFWENIPRVLPDNTQAVIDESSWQWPAVFNWLQTAGNVSSHEMYRTFNCGVGMVIALPASEADKAVKLLTEKGENAWKIGTIKASDSEQRVVIE